MNSRELQQNIRCLILCLFIISHFNAIFMIFAFYTHLTFTLLCSQSPDFFSFSSCKTESLYSFKKRKKQHVPPFSQCLTTTILLSVSMNLTTLSNSCKWNSTISVFLWLAYFTKHNILMFIHTGAYVKMSFCIKTE